MNKLLTLQITALILISGSLVGMSFYTDVYEEIQSRIVLVLCLSCMKLEPKTILEFTFETATDDSHPEFIIENLTKGPIFLHYSEDVCHGCDIMYPIILDLLNIEFDKKDMVYEIIPFDETNIVYYYINIDHTNKQFRESLPIYDKDHIGGLPMFTVITVGYDHGIVKPYYTSVYGTVGFDNDPNRFMFLDELLKESISVYSQNIEGYSPE